MPSRRAISCVDTQEDFSRIISRAPRISIRSAGTDCSFGSCQRGDLIRPTTAPANPRKTPGGIIPLWGARSSRNRGAASSRYRGRHHPGIGGRLPPESAGERVMASVSRFLTNKLRLKVNEAKSAVARPEERKFLGFSIANDGSERRIAPKALAKFKAQIRDMTRRTRGNSLPQVIEDLAPYLLGWRGYFGFCQTPRVLTNLEAWIRRRLRAYLWRQWQNGPNRFKELRQRGVPKFSA